MLYRNRILKYAADADVKWGDRTIRRGDIVEELGSIGEGFCTLRHGGVIFEAECLSISTMGTVPFTRVPGQQGGSEEWFQALCKEGKTAWILREDLKALHSPDVKDVVIIDGVESAH